MSNNFNLIHTRLEDLYGSDRMVLEYKKNHTSSTFSSDHNVAGFDVVFSDNLIESGTKATNNLSDLLNDASFKQIFESNINNNNLLKEDNHLESSSSSSSKIDGEITNSVDKTQNTNDNVIYSLPAKIVLSTLASTASLITICGNLLVMISFFLDRQIRNPTNYFILSLSVSDFVIGLISIPFLTFYLMIGEWPFGEIICNLWLSLDYTVCLTSIYTVLFITIDRFCSVKMPAKYRKWRSPNKIIIMVMLTWIVPISLFFPSIFGWSYLSRTEDFDSRICDVAWSSNKVFSVLLVFSYFWTTLIAIIVLYIFIYQVALNLEKKSREKQLKISSLVGCSATNTRAIVGALALPSNMNLNKVSSNTNNNSTSFNKQEDTDSNSKLSKGSSQITAKHSEKKSPTQNLDTKLSKIDDIASGNNSKSPSRLSSLKAGLRKSIKARNSLTNKDKIDLRGEITTQSLTNNNNTQNTARKQSISYLKANHVNPSSLLFKKKSLSSNTPIKLNKSDLSNNLKASKNQNLSYTSQTNSRDDEFSSSYDSHSDYDLKSNAKFLLHQPNNNMKPNISSDLSNQNILLQPRPESLAIMSYDLFAEKCQKQQNQQSSTNTSNVNINNKSPNIDQPKTNDAQISNNNNNNIIEKSDKPQSTATKPQIPFIDDEFDDLSYILHRRQFDKENHRIPIKEETILIKSGFKNLTFFQKLSAPIKSLSSRRSSQRSNELQFMPAASNAGTPTKNGADANSFNNQTKTKLEVLSKSFTNNKSTELNKAEENNRIEMEVELEENPEKVGLLSNNKTARENNETTKKTDSPFKLQPTNTTTSNTTESTSTNNITNKSPNNLNSTSADQSPFTINLQSKTKSNANPNPTSNVTTNSNQTQSLTRSNIFSRIASRIVSTHGSKNKNNNSVKRKIKHENRARKALRTITFILAAFIFCFAPWHVVSVYNSFCANCFDSKLYHHFFYSCYFLCYMNSPINPFMYALANQQFKKTFIRILKGDWRRL
jgi:muscarinic acetylcholine receptor M3